MLVPVSEELYNTLYGLYNSVCPEAFLGNNTIDMGALMDADIYEFDGDGYYNYNLRPSQEGYFIPNNV